MWQCLSEFVFMQGFGSADLLADSLSCDLKRDGWQRGVSNRGGDGQSALAAWLHFRVALEHDLAAVADGGDSFDGDSLRRIAQLEAGFV
jgi:hypothetical protein